MVRDTCCRCASISMPGLSLRPRLSNMGRSSAPSSDPFHDVLRLLLVHLGVDLRHDRRRMPEDGAGHVESEFLAEPCRRVVPELVGMPAVGPMPFLQLVAMIPAPLF